MSVSPGANVLQNACSRSRIIAPEEVSRKTKQVVELGIEVEV